MKKLRDILIITLLFFTILLYINPYANSQISINGDKEKLVIEETKENEYEFYTKDNDRIDIKSINNNPQFTIYKWNEESYFRVDIPNIQTSNSLSDNKLTWSNSLIDINLYPLDSSVFGSLEFEINFKSNPLFSSMNFPIEYKNLEFIYQDILTKEEIEQDIIRPDNITYSYAVYHESKKNNEYTTGKAFHIYRPILIDSLGSESWASINIDTENNVMSYSWNPLFMNTAIYPVRLMPNFGKTDVGASWMGGFYATNIAVAEYTMGATSGTLDSITVWFQDSGENFIANIYDDSTSHPNNLIGESSETVTSGSNTWQTATMASESLTGSAVYHLGAIVETDNAGRMDSGSSEQRTNNLNTYASGSPDPFLVSGHTHQNQEISIYATYTEVGAITTSTLIVNETLTIDDNFSFTGIFEFTEQLGINDDFFNTWSYYLISLVETLTIDDNFFSSFGAILIELSETLLISDTLTTIIGGSFLLALLENLVIGDNLTSIIPIQVGLTFWHYYTFIALLTFMGVFFITVKGGIVRKMIASLCFSTNVILILTYAGLPLALIGSISAIYASLAVTSLLIGIESAWLKKPDETYG